jgi:N-ethylmaleimide reductase
MHTFGYLLEQLSPLNLAFAHITRVTAQDIAHGATQGVGPRELRSHYRGRVIANGGFTLETGNQALSEGWADAVAFGVPFLANPDLPKRLQTGAPLNEADASTFYTPGAKGYTDYPTHAS